MFDFKIAQSNDNFLKAMDETFARIEFTPDGNILFANQNFLGVMGYTLTEVVGQHHQMFVEKSYAASKEYKDFWRNLRDGQANTAEFPRKAKNGATIWIQASYIPVKTGNKVTKVIKLATDVTAQKDLTANAMGQLAAINRAEGVIEFNLDGTVRKANANFLSAIGYTEDEIIGQHHRMFVTPEYAASPDYTDFWQKLGSGEYITGEFLRLNKAGQNIWIQASYNPIMNPEGQVYKIVKYARDITQSKERSAYYESLKTSISASQAMIEFKPDGTILEANDLFLQTMGYELDEIVGQHHRLFVEASYGTSADYAGFWARLRSGEAQTAEFKRIAKDGSDVWIHAVYNPIKDHTGQVYRVVKLATNITELMEGRLEAAVLSQAVTGSIQTIAGAAEEMMASIQEITSNMSRSQQSVTDIIAKNQDAEALTARLQTNTKSMEKIADIIREISDQVNLLALNAIIESARAGEAGKGFAVVAAEVKNLASATAKATDQISDEIAAIQAIANQVYQSGTVIADQTKDMGEYVGSVAAAVEEQSSATQEISRNMSQITTTMENLDACIEKLAQVEDQGSQDQATRLAAE